MHDKKLSSAVVVLVVALVAWFIPAPAGLCETSVSAEVANKANVFLGKDEKLRVSKVPAALAVLEDNATDSGEFSPKQLRAVETGQVAVSGENADQLATELGQRSWRLFVIFAATILLILLNTMPIFTAAIGALAIAIVTGTLTPTAGYSGFSKGFIVVIVVAFTIAIGVSKSGLGQRIAWMIISRFGSSSLGLGYSLILTDLLISPAFPSNTARSGVLFPVMDAVARGRGSKPEPESRKKLGAFLAMNSVLGLSLSSAMWMTAMAANPPGAKVAGDVVGITIDFAMWAKASCVPTLCAFFTVPVVLYFAFRPELRSTPEAPQAAREALTAMGPMSKQEKIMAGVFSVLVGLWALSGVLGLDVAAVAIAGLAILMLTKVITLADVRGSSGPITFVWFAALYTLSTYLDNYGFMQWIGESVAAQVTGMAWPKVYVLLIVAYVLIHYFFVSQTAHMFAVMPIFLSVGVAAGVPGALLAMMLLLTTNFFSPITPQASSANAIFVGSGYLSMGEVYRYGGMVTLLNTIIYLTIGTAWLQFVL
jgi:DASS family divalent anion:Na+ symporter